MKGIVVIMLGLILIGMCGYGYRYMQIDGRCCGLLAFFVGGGMITSGINMASASDHQIIAEDEEEEKA